MLRLTTATTRSGAFLVSTSLALAVLPLQFLRDCLNLLDVATGPTVVAARLTFLLRNPIGCDGSVCS
jgi:hypothetical protein